jgi:hypothetical protein
VLALRPPEPCSPHALEMHLFFFLSTVAESPEKKFFLRYIFFKGVGKWNSEKMREKNRRSI